MVSKMYVAAKALIKKNNKFLIVQQQVGNTVFIDLPGGRVEKGFSLTDTLYREVTEETTLVVKSHRIVGDYFFIRERDDDQVVCVLYECEVEGEVEITNDFDENLVGYKWLTFDELKSSNGICHPSFIECLARFIK